MRGYLRNKKKSDFGFLLFVFSFFFSFLLYNIWCLLAPHSMWEWRRVRIISAPQNDITFHLQFYFDLQLPFFNSLSGLRSQCWLWLKPQSISFYIFQIHFETSLLHFNSTLQNNKALKKKIPFIFRSIYNMYILVLSR